MYVQLHIHVHAINLLCYVGSVIVRFWQCCQRISGIEDVCVLLVLAYLAVAEHDVAAAVLCYLGVVRDEDDGAPLAVEFLEEA